MTEILLVQHAGGFETHSYTSGQFDPHIGPVGVARAEALRDRLRSRRIDAFYTSGMHRSAETIDILAAGRDAPILVNEDLREIFLGDYEPIHPRINDLLHEAYTGSADADPNIVRFLRSRCWDDIPGSEGDEPFRKRCRQAIDDIASAWPDGTVVVGGHGASVAAIVAETLGVRHTFFFWPERCSLTSFMLRDGVATFLLMNDCRDRDLLYESASPVYGPG